MPDKYGPEHIVSCCKTCVRDATHQDRTSVQTQRLTKRARHGRGTPQKSGKNAPKHRQIVVAADISDVLLRAVGRAPHQLVDDALSELGWLIHHAIRHEKRHQRRRHHVSQVPARDVTKMQGGKVTNMQGGGRAGCTYARTGNTMRLMARWLRYSVNCLSPFFFFASISTSASAASSRLERILENELLRCL